MEVQVADIFEAIPKRYNAANASGWTAGIQFNLDTDAGPEPWFIKVDDGALNVGQGEIEEPTATIIARAETWVGMSTGTVDPMQAFMTGQLRVEGNMGDVMKLQDSSIFSRE